MKCPACFNQLTQIKVGSFVVDVCKGGCGGMWFDAFELQRVDDAHDTEGNVLMHVERDPAVVVDSNRKRECPRCPGIKLRRHFYSAQRRFLIDHCPNCAGYWLDAGELEQVHAERSREQAKQPPATGNVSSDFIRYLYRLQQSARKEEQQ